MSRSRSRFYVRLVCLAGGLLAAVAVAQADVVIVESRVVGGGVTPDPPYAELSGNWGNSTLKSTAAGATSGVGSRFATRPYSWYPTSVFRISPTLAVPGGQYQVHVTHGPAASVSSNVTVNISQLNCTGLPPSTTAFRRRIISYSPLTYTDNTWQLVGTLTLDPGQTTPIITFTSSAAYYNRFYADAVKFTYVGDPCIAGLPELTTVSGPLAAGQTSVDIPHVDGSATKVTVYADGVNIGERTSGIVAGTNTVTTTAPLVKGQRITATQTNALNIESCRPSGGPAVGGGANPSLRISLSIRKDTSLTGPIGANAGAVGSMPLKYLGATGRVGGWGTAPVGGKVITPGICWQEVSFLRGNDHANPVDPTYAWFMEDGINNIEGDFGVLDAIALAVEDTTDTGPFVIYIDNLMNGSQLIEDFEGSAVGTSAVTFRRPSFSNTTNSFLLNAPPEPATPDVCEVTDAFAYTSLQSAMVSWQFRDAVAENWLRLNTQAVLGHPNPQVDLRLPISFRILVLPVGESNSDATPPTITITAPASGALYQVGDAVSFSATYVENCGLASATWRLKSDLQDITEPGIIDATNGTISLSHAFLGPGVYAVELTAVDESGNVARVLAGPDDLPAFVVVYDPSAGFVSGGGWFDSPAGAYTADPALTGKASFGFVSKYKRGTTVPEGNTEFHFQAADLNFHSTAYNWLVVAGARAQFMGTGVINGTEECSFLLTAIDGQVNGGGGTDKFRILIRGTNGVVYDNLLGAADGADPTTVIGGGSIVIHQ